MSFTEIISWPFAQLMKLCLLISGNYYIIGLLFFALIMQIVLLPIGIKQHKSSVTQRKLRPKEMAIRKKYAGRTDRATQQKMTLEIQDMYRENGYNQFASCLPLLLQLPIILILFSIVKSPIQYSSTSAELEKDWISGKLYTDAVDLVKEYKNNDLYEGGDYAGYEKQLNTVLASFGAKDDGSGNFEYKAENPKGTNSQMELTKLIQNGRDYFKNIAEEKGVTIKDDANRIDLRFPEEYKEALPSFEFFGKTSLLDTPTLSLNFLLLIPLLVFVTSFFSGVINRKIMGDTMAPEGGVNTNGWLMKWGMPAMSFYFAFNVPGAVGVYWIWRTIVGGLQPIILNHFYPLPIISAEEIAAIEKEMKKKKKKKVIMIEVDEDDDSYRDIEVKGRPVTSSGNKNSSGKKKYIVNNKIEMLSADDDDEPEESADEEESDDK